MPIHPDRRKLYPGGSPTSPEMKALRALVLDRGGNRCEGTPQNPDCRAENGQPHPITGSNVVLTTAHMDWDEAHADPERCRALCQRCHNQWDSPQRQKNARRTRFNKIGQPDLLPREDPKL